LFEHEFTDNFLHGDQHVLDEVGVGGRGVVGVDVTLGVLVLIQELFSYIASRIIQRRKQKSKVRSMGK